MMMDVPADVRKDPALRLRAWWIRGPEWSAQGESRDPVVAIHRAAKALHDKYGYVPEGTESGFDGLETA